jgi:hypothetical protein
MRFTANRVTSLGLCSCKPQGVLRALRVTLLFTVLASTPGLAEDPQNAGASPVVSIDHNTFISSEITVAVPSGKWLEFDVARSPGNMKVSFQAARSIV